jgi:hypothetical protein
VRREDRARAPCVTTLVHEVGVPCPLEGLARVDDSKISNERCRAATVTASDDPSSCGGNLGLTDGSATAAGLLVVDQDIGYIKGLGYTHAYIGIGLNIEGCIVSNCNLFGLMQGRTRGKSGFCFSSLVTPGEAVSVPCFLIILRTELYC